MGFFDMIFGKRRRTLNDISIDELNRERITLEQEQRKLDTEADRLFRDEKKLRSEYAASETPMQKRSTARKIQDIRAKLEALETRSLYCSKMLRSVNGFLTVKGNADFFKRMGVGSLIADMDVAEIERYITDATVEGTLHQEKLAATLRQLEGGLATLNEGIDDPSLDELMRELDADLDGPAVTEERPEREKTVDVETEKAVKTPEISPEGETPETRRRITE